MPLSCSPWHYKPAQGWRLSLRGCWELVVSDDLAKQSYSAAAPLPHLLALYEGSAPLPTSSAPCPAPQPRPASWIQTSRGEIKARSSRYFPFLFPARPAVSCFRLAWTTPASQEIPSVPHPAGVCLAQGSQPAGRTSLPPPPTPTSALRGVGQRFSRLPQSNPLHPCLIAYFWAIMFDRENLFLSGADLRTVSDLWGFIILSFCLWVSRTLCPTAKPRCCSDSSMEPAGPQEH